MLRVRTLLALAFFSFGSIAVAAPTPPQPPQPPQTPQTPQKEPTLVHALVVSEEATTKIEALAVAGSIVIKTPPPPPKGVAPPKRLSGDLVFDTSKERIDVRKRIAELQSLTQTDGKLRRPPVVKLVWGGGENGQTFHGVIESIRIRYTMFLADGTPCRATTTIHMRESQRCFDDSSCPTPMVCRTGYCSRD